MASGRHFLSHHGSMYTADSPHLLFEFTEALEKVGLRDILAGHLGERPAMSVKKGTLRRVPHDTGSGWHQDGAFLGEGIRTVNVWLTLTDCSGAPEGRAPGLEIVPRRFEEVLETGTHGAIFDWSVGDGLADEIAQETPTIKPVYRAGDAMLFDELLLHRTSVHPQMDTNRYTIETWFFAPSVYPDEQVAIAF